MKIHFFTITELVVAMGVFGMLSLFTLQMFSGIQKAWSRSNTETETYETAHIIMDMITEELKNIIDPNAYDKTLDSSLKNKYFCFKKNSDSEITYLTKTDGELKQSGFRKNGLILYRKEYKISEKKHYPFCDEEQDVDKEHEIAENVVSLKFSVYAKDYTVFSGSNFELPAYVIVELKLIDIPYLNEYKSTISEDSSWYLQHVHTYKRLIAINTTE